VLKLKHISFANDIVLALAYGCCHRLHLEQCAHIWRGLRAGIP
jgi:hypothetical protein